MRDPVVDAYNARRRGTTRQPQYGNEVVIPSGHPDGHWCNGIVNSGHPSCPTVHGRLVVAATGHAMSNVVLVSDLYGIGWCWPEDLGMKATGSKKALLADVEG